MKLNSYLVKSRHGIYYLRLQRHGLDKRISLRTKDLSSASTAAYRFGATMSAMNDKIKFASQAEILAEEQFKEQIKHHEMRERAYARLDALKDQQAEDEYFQTLLAQNPHLSQQIQSQIQKNTQQPALVLKKMCLRDAVNDYKPALAKSKQAEKSKKMALSTLNDLSVLNCI